MLAKPFMLDALWADIAYMVEEMDRLKAEVSETRAALEEHRQTCPAAAA